MRHKFVWAIFSVCLLLILMVGWLLTTHAGLRTVVSLAEQMVPDLKIESAEGRLIDEVDLRHITYKPDDAVGLQVTEVQLDWQPSALLKATLLVEKLTVGGVTIFLTEAEQAKTTEPVVLPEVELPLRIELNELSIASIETVSVTDEKVVLVNQLRAGLAIDYDRLEIKQLSVNRDDADIELRGELALQSPYHTGLQYRVALKQALAQPMQIEGQVKGDINQLDIAQTIEAPFTSKQSVTLTNILSELGWQLELEAESLDLAEFGIDQQTQLTSTTIQAEGNLTSLNAQLATQIAQAEIPAISVTAELSSEDFELWAIKTQADISQQSQLSVIGDIQLSEDLPSAELQATWQNLSWPLDSNDALVKSAEGSLIFSGSTDAYTANIETALEIEQQLLNVSAKTEGNQNAIEIKQLVAAGWEGKLNADGRLNWQTSPLQYQLNAEWQGLQLPASLTPLAVVLEQGEIKLDGTTDALSLSTQADFLLDDVSMSLDADASGRTDSGFDSTQLSIVLEQGKLNYKGKLLWADKFVMEGDLSLQKINPGVLAAAWPGQLSGNTQLRVATDTNSAIQLHATDIDIHGSLRQRPLKLKGDVDYSQTLLDIEQLLLESGDSSMQVNGQLNNNRLAFNWQLKSPDLQDFYPDLYGQMNLTGNAKGSLQLPEIKADLAGSDIRYQQMAINKLAGDIQLAMSKDAEISSHIQLAGVVLPTLTMDELNVELSGHQQNHDIRLNMASEDLIVAMSAKGGLTQQNWRGNFNSFSLKHTQAGNWTLQKHGELILSKAEQHLPQHCWASTEGDFCIEADSSDAGWQTSGQFNAVPLSLFQAFVSELEQLQGKLRGNFNLTADKGEAIIGNGEIFLDDASLKLDQTALNQQKPVPINNTSLSYQISAEQTKAQLHIEPDLEGVSAIDADFETVGLNQLLDDSESAPIQGRVTTEIEDLSQLQLSHPMFTDLNGRFSLNLTVSGTTTKPQLNGEARLVGGQIALTDAGILLEQVEADIKGNLNQVMFDYQAVSGEGKLQGEGNFSLEEAGWELKTAFKAQQFTLMNTPEALVIAEPDMSVVITPTLTTIKGQVTIPEAELEPTQFNTSVSPSQDVIVITDQATDEKAGTDTEVDIKLVLGDKVKLKALGFQGRLTGDLRVSGKTSDILLGNGEIKIKDGSYLAYGQLLKVDDGSIRFAGGAIDNPELDIKAVRVGKDYKAGLHIEGYATAPQANLFSEPQMSQDDILSYILLGKAVENASATDAALLASAATGMGLQNGAMIGDEIASTFGLDEFSVQGDSAENAAVQVGKYLSPKLYLSYGIGVFESVSTVELRYQLSKIWSLKAESGTESGIDLLYSYERGGPE